MARKKNIRKKMERQAIGIINNSLNRAGGHTGEELNRERSQAIKSQLKSKIEEMKGDLPHSEIKGRGKYLSDICREKKIPESKRGKGKTCCLPMTPENRAKV